MTGVTEYTVADIYDYISKVRIILIHPQVAWSVFFSFFFRCHYNKPSKKKLKNTAYDACLFFSQHEERAFVLKFSAIEIYNEVVRDLLSAENTPLRLWDDAEVKNRFPFYHCRL